MNNQLRSLLCEYFSAAIEAFNLKNVGLTSSAARVILAAPTPAAAAKLTRTQLRSLLRKAGRQRNIPTWVERLHGVFRTEQIRQLSMVEEAFGHQTQALITQLDAACQAADQLAEAAIEAITSFPSLGELTGARILAELGDDHTRFANARSLKAYAGSAPITRASGKSHTVRHRKIKNKRLAAVGYT
jgi:transposase